MVKIHRKLIIGSAITLVLAICEQFPIAVQNANAAKIVKAPVSVPLIGCKSDGQVGPVNALTGKRKIVQVPVQAAQHLAYYKSEYGFGVLGPRGWYCFSTYGSNGSTLYVSPAPINTADLFSTSWRGFTGSVMQITDEDGGTSGRFGVATIIARVFPACKEFVRDVMNEDIEAGINPPNSYPTGPYPKDKLTYRGKNIVEYITPGKTEGLGTHSMLQKNTDPISGVAILVGQKPDLLLLATRLPDKQRAVAPIIIQQAERETANSSNAN